MNTQEIVMYKKDNKNAIRVWIIQVVDYDIVISHGIENGTLQEKTEEVLEGKGGRSLEDQIYSRVASRIKKQKDKGYSQNREDAKRKSTNALDLKMAMTAAKLRDVSVIKDGAFIQLKYDGNRCLVTRRNGILIAYSRNGKEFKSIDHILEALEPIIEEGQTLDGELYHHGTRLQTLRSWISKGQKESKKLCYMIYDMICPSPYSERKSELETVLEGKKFPIQYVPTVAYKGMDQAKQWLKMAREKGYEGLMIRHGGEGYEDGKRSKSLVKVKVFDDSEAVVIGFEESADGWAVLVCELECGAVFKMSAPGSVPEKKEVLENPHKYLGQGIRFEYACLTKDGIPFHPTAIEWRNKEDE